MKVSKRINVLRGNIMHRLTRNVGNAHKIPQIDPSEKIEINRVLIIRPNHRLGNQLLLTPIVQEVIDTFPSCKVDLFVKGGVAFPVFENYKNVENIFTLPKKPFNNIFKYLARWTKIKKNQYDLVINGDKNSSSGRLLTQLSRARFKIFGEVEENVVEKYSDYTHISKYPIYNFRQYMSKLGFPRTNLPLPRLNIKLNEKEIGYGKEILYSITKNHKKTICIYTNATGNKCYSEEWWEKLYKRLLITYPDYNIIEMLPIENISKINFQAPNFYSKDIREMGAIISNTSIFISADNGVMHLASASQTPTVGFFSVTSPAIYAPYGNGSLAFDTENSNIQDWLEAIKKILN